MPAARELCQLVKRWDGRIPESGAMVELKHNGIRCLWFRGIDGRARLWSRNGIPIEGCAHIARDLAMLEEAAGAELFIDGELIVDGTLAATKAWVEKGWKLGGNAGAFHAFDVMTQAEWQRGGTDRPLHERKAMLHALIGQARDSDSERWDWPEGSRGQLTECAVQLVDNIWIDDPEGVEVEANRVWAAGHEGLMIKDPHAGYWRTRNLAWLKVKEPAAWGARAA